MKMTVAGGHSRFRPRFWMVSIVDSFVVILTFRLSTGNQGMEVRECCWKGSN